MKVRIESLPAPEGRLIAISDIHGHSAFFDSLLARLSPTPADSIVICGDMTEKGPDSLGVLRRVMELSRRSMAHALLGNVDMRVLDAFSGKMGIPALYAYQQYLLKWWGSTLLRELCVSRGICWSNERELRAAMETLRGDVPPEIRYLMELPHAIDTPKALFVHAGCDTSDISALSSEEAQNVYKIDAFMSSAPCLQRYAVVGHWPVTLYSESAPCSNPLADDVKHIISIDGGCGIKHDGQLNALVMEKGDPRQRSFVSYDDFQRIRADEGQSENAECINIMWTDNALQLICRGEEFSRVRHVSSDKLLEMPNSFLREENGAFHCVDYTTHEVGAREGDTMSLLMRTSKGALVKKDGVTGWYRGGFTYVTG